jgi:transposase
MHITREQFKRIRPLLPRPRGGVRISHYRFLNALAYMADNGCKWRSLPARFGPWHTVYMRLQRWARNGQLDAILCHLQQERLSLWCVEALSLDSTIVKVHPDGCGAQKKTAPKP